MESVGYIVIIGVLICVVYLVSFTDKDYKRIMALAGVGIIASTLLIVGERIAHLRVFGLAEIKTEARKELSEIQSIRKEIEEHRDSIRDMSGDIDDAKKKLTELARLSNEATARVRDLENVQKRTKEGMTNFVLVPGFREMLARKSQSGAMTLYEQLQEVNPREVDLKLRLAEIEAAIITPPGPEGPGDYTALLCRILEDTRIPFDRIYCFYLILANAILVNKVDRHFANGKTFDAILHSFTEYVREYEDQEIVPEYALMDVDRLFALEDQGKQRLYQRVRDLVPTSNR